MSTNSPICDPNDIHPNGGWAAGTGITISSNSSWSSYNDTEELKERMSQIEKRLSIVVPDKELQKRFPALQEAYEHYKLIEALVYNENDKN